MSHQNSPSSPSANTGGRQPDNEARFGGGFTNFETPHQPQDPSFGMSAEEQEVLCDQLRNQDPLGPFADDQGHDLPPSGLLTSTSPAPSARRYPPSASPHTFSAPAPPPFWQPQGGYQGHPTNVYAPPVYPSGDPRFAYPANMRQPIPPQQTYDDAPSMRHPRPNRPQQAYGELFTGSNAQRLDFQGVYGGGAPGGNAQPSRLPQAYGGLQTGSDTHFLNFQGLHAGTPAGGNRQPAGHGQLHGAAHTGTNARPSNPQGLHAGAPTGGNLQHAGLAQTLVAAPASANTQPVAPQSAYGAFSTRFTNPRDARQHLNRVRWRVQLAPGEHDDIPANDADRRRYANMVYDALIDLSNIAADAQNSRFPKRFRVGHYHQMDVEARAFDVVQVAEDLHQRGSTLMENLDGTQTRSAARSMRFSRRIEEVCRVLRAYKTACVEVMEGSKIQQLVNNPKAAMTKKRANENGNAKKAVVMSEGKEAKKRKETQTQATQQAPPNKKRKTDTQAVAGPAAAAGTSAEEEFEEEELEGQAGSSSAARWRPIRPATGPRGSRVSAGYTGGPTMVPSIPSYTSTNNPNYSYAASAARYGQESSQQLGSPATPGPVAQAMGVQDSSSRMGSALAPTTFPSLLQGTTPHASSLPDDISEDLPERLPAALLNRRPNPHSNAARTRQTPSRPGRSRLARRVSVQDPNSAPSLQPDESYDAHEVMGVWQTPTRTGDISPRTTFPSTAAAFPDMPVNALSPSYPGSLTRSQAARVLQELDAAAASMSAPRAMGVAESGSRAEGSDTLAPPRTPTNAFTNTPSNAFPDTPEISERATRGSTSRLAPPSEAQQVRVTPFSGRRDSHDTPEE